MAKFIYADNHTEHVPSPGIRIMNAIANIDNKLPDNERVVAINPENGEQYGLLISLFNALTGPQGTPTHCNNNISGIGGTKQ